VAIVVVTFLLIPSTGSPDGGQWWDVVPEPEVPSSYYDSILYSEIAPRLREIELNSNRVSVDVLGQSAGGRNLFLATVTDPSAYGKFGEYKSIRNTMLSDPVAALAMLDTLENFKVPVFINAGIHGHEYTGVDAAMRIIETLAYDTSPEVQAILDHVIVLVNVVQNPDGRVWGIRRNGAWMDNYFDFITQSQPETVATVGVLTEWNPLVMIDLHDALPIMRIEPCTPPHNPNYEYDLYIGWALDLAEAMEAELIDRTDETEAIIPFRDLAEMWDDWTPIFPAMYAMFHGAYGVTADAPHRDERGVDAHYAAVWGALEYVAANKEAMIRDQIEVFRRGFLDLPQVPIPADVLARTPYDQYNHLTTIDFPEAHVLPAAAPLQRNPVEAARLVDFLLTNGVQVTKATSSFTLNSVDYPEGTYVVWMDQPKRGLANTILWAGWDISTEPGLDVYRLAGSSHPLLWGVTHAVMEAPTIVSTQPVSKAKEPRGTSEKTKTGAYAFLPTGNTAIEAATELLDRGISLARTKTPFTDDGRSFGAGTFVIPIDSSLPGPLVNELKNDFGLNVFALGAVPASAVSMRSPSIAVSVSSETFYVLESLGFAPDRIDASDINGGDLVSGGYDVYFNESIDYTALDAAGLASLASFVSSGGDYVGLGNDGVEMAVDAGLIHVVDVPSPTGGSGIVKIDFDPTDPVVAQYPEAGHAFVYGPVWFTSLGSAVETAASISTGDFLVSGYWPAWDTGGAAGMPVIVHETHGSGEVTLIGISPCHVAHPRDTFRILANAVYNGLN
jgi:hypothetical protein